jgi:hypothetical protein
LVVETSLAACGGRHGEDGLQEFRVLLILLRTHAAWPRGNGSDVGRDRETVTDEFRLELEGNGDDCEKDYGQKALCLEHLRFYSETLRLGEFLRWGFKFKWIGNSQSIFKNLVQTWKKKCGTSKWMI